MRSTAHGCVVSLLILLCIHSRFLILLKIMLHFLFSSTEVFQKHLPLLCHHYPLLCPLFTQGGEEAMPRWTLGWCH